MAKGDYRKNSTHLRKRRRTNMLVGLLGIILILSLAVGGTFAYLKAVTNKVENQFAPARVACIVNSGSDGTFDVKNDSDVDAYIRAAIVVNWMDDNGNVRGIAPVATEVDIKVNTTDWWQDSNTGYYYYKRLVSSEEVTEDLITSFGLAERATVPNGYQLSVEVVAEAIQAAGVSDSGESPVYKLAWGISSITGS